MKAWDWSAVGVDLAGTVLAVLLLPGLTAQMREQTTGNVLLLVLFFILFCVAVYLVRKLEPEMGRQLIPDSWVAPRLLRILAILFGTMMMILALDQFEYWDLIFIVDDRELGAGESSAFFVYGPGAWLGAALFYVLVLSAGVRPTIAVGSPRYQTIAALSLLVINGMVLMGTAVLAAAFTRWQLAPWLSAVLLPLTVVAFWGPPRLWYLVKRPSIPPILSYLLLLLVTTILALWV